MAGPSIVVRVLGDLKGLGAAMDGAGKTAQGAASKAHAAFGSFLSGLNQTGVLGPFGAALAGINDAVGQVIEHAHQIGPAMIGAGAAITGVGALLSGIGSKEQASHQQLQAAIQATGHDYEEYGKQIEAAIKHQEHFGHTADETQDAIRILTQATGNTGTALKYMNTASDLAAAKHISLSKAAQMLGKAYNGNTRILKEMGIQIPKTVDVQKALATAQTHAQTAAEHVAKTHQKLLDIEQQYAGKTHLTVTEQQRLRDALQNYNAAVGKSRAANATLVQAQQDARNGAATHGAALDLLSKKLAGQASAAADTFGGHLAAIKAKIEDQVATFGQKYGPALQTAGIALMAFGSIQTIVAAISWSAVLPILAIIAAIAALVVAGYVIYRNWSTIWGAIKAVVVGVWDWIRTHWPLLLGILLGPIAVAVVLIIRYWDTIKNAAAAAVNWIRTHWQLLLAILTGPIGIAVTLILRYWNVIRSAAGAAVNYVKAVWSSIVGFFAGLVARIGGTLAAMFNAALRAAGTVVGAVQRAWNGFAGWIGGFVSRVSSGFSRMFDGALAAVRAVTGTIQRIWDDTIGRLKVPDIPGPIKTLGHALHIPGLQTGGYIRDAGIAYLHAGETVIPAHIGIANTAPAAARAGPAGPAVVIEQAQFGDPVDVDVLMRRVAWQLQRRAV